MLLNFLVNADEFRCLNPSVASTSVLVNYVKCHFDTSSLTDVDAVVAVFKSASYNEQYEVLLDSNGDCYVDPVVFRRGGVVQIKLVGDRYVDGTVISSTFITPVIEVLFNTNIIVPTPVPSKYDVFIAELEQAKLSVEQIIALLAEKVAAGDFDGEDGVGIASVTYNQDGTVNITLTDGNTFTSDYSMKGDTGAAGADGAGIANIVYGQDGTVVITLTDGNTFTSDYSMKGETGAQGVPGEQGADGVSPEVTISSITGGNRVTITDAEHPLGHSFDVMNGVDGQDGRDGVDGTTFIPSVSNAGVISWTNDGGKQNPQSVDLVSAVIDALPTWSGGEY